MKSLSVIDAETDPFEHGEIPEPFIWGYYNGHDFITFNSTKNLAEYISGKKEIIFAHNGGKFDFHYLLEYVDSPNMLVINGRIVEMRVGTAILRDSFAIYPMPLSAYKKDEIDYSKMKRDRRHKYMGEIISYLRSDCIYLHELVTAFFNEFGDKRTLASAGFYKSKQLCEIKNFQTGRYFYSLFQRYYHGGRVTVFQRGIFPKTSYIYDINSAYPYAMIHDHPFGNEVSITKSNFHLNPLSFYDVQGIARGCFPYLDEKNHLSFPDDDIERDYHITGHELITALETETFDGDILKQATFINTVNFASFINHYYERKKKAKKHSTEYILAKFTMNSMYGKLAANPDNYVDYTICKPENAKAICEKEKSLPVYLCERYALLCKAIPDSRKRFYNVATAASITGFVRAYLWRAIQRLKRDGANIYYCDTDSLITNKPELSDTGPNLGQWALEQSNDMLYIHAPKIYAARRMDGSWKIASKGVHLSHNEIKRLVNGGTVTWNNPAPTYSLKKETSFISRSL